jgi:hypothetical protein
MRNLPCVGRPRSFQGLWSHRAGGGRGGEEEKEGKEEKEEDDEEEKKDDEEEEEGQVKHVLLNQSAVKASK